MKTIKTDANCHKCLHNWKCLRAIMTQYNVLSGKPSDPCYDYVDDQGHAVGDDISPYTKNEDQVERDAIRNVSKSKKQKDKEHSEAHRTVDPMKDYFNPVMYEKLKDFKVKE